MQDHTPTVTRREFIRLAAGASAGLTLGVSLSGCDIDSDESSFQPNLWVRIDPDGTIRVILAEAEMGQGVATALPMLVAEELEVALEQIVIERAPLSPEYGYQSTGGSSSVRRAWDPLRRAGATAREMVRRAAAGRWKVDISMCEARDGVVTRSDTGEFLSYGDLSVDASRLMVPTDVTLKDPSQCRLIGRSQGLLDARGKVTGETIFGSDVKLPDMLVAAIKHAPHIGGTLADYDGTSALRMPGVRAVVPLKNAVAVVASNFWQASQALAKVGAQWAPGPTGGFSSEDLFGKLSEALEKEGEVYRNDGDAETILNSVPEQRRVAAEYRLPFQAHAPMEPMVCVAHVRDDQCEIWVPTQSPSGAQQAAFEAMYSGPAEIWHKVKKKLRGGFIDSITVNVTDIGGGFGRRLYSDFVSEAVTIAKQVDGPVKLLWSREEDLRNDPYHPMTLHRLEAALDGDGQLAAWRHQIAGPTAHPAGARDLPYAIPSVRVSTHEADLPVQVGAWRSVAHAYNGFVTECFLDEIAGMTGEDPLALRLRLLDGEPRLRHVLTTVAERAGWSGRRTDGRSLGVAVHKGFGSYVAHVAEVVVSERGRISVQKVTSAFDCGRMVNPDTVRAQIEGSIAFGLTATIKSAITIQDGRIQEENFDQFPLLRFKEMPEIEIILVDSIEEPGGVGEPAVPPIGPAVANAVFAATGQRMRTQPFRVIRD